MTICTKPFETYKKQLFYALLFTFAWGLLAHGYCFVRSSFSHDSLNEFNGSFPSDFNGANTVNQWKVQLGRFGVPIYRDIFRTDLTLPWLVGMLALLWIGLSVFCIVRLFRMESKASIFLVCGILTCNLTVTATAATYLHDFDCDMFALLCAVVAVTLWRKIPWGSLLGALGLAAVMAIYPSYLSVTIVLIMYLCMVDLLDGASFQAVFRQGLKAIGMILLGGILYYAALQVVLAYTGTSLASGLYNSLDAASGLADASIPELIRETYSTCLHYLLHAPFPYPSWVLAIITAFMGVVIVLGLLCGIREGHLGWPEILLLLALTALLGLGMNITYILTVGMIHDLMVYAIWLFYLLAVLMAQRLTKLYGGKAVWVRSAVSLLVCVFLYGNVQIANGLYLKKDMEEKAFLSFMTRVLYRMEACEDYVPGDSPVVFVGISDQLHEVMPDFPEYAQITGNFTSQSIYTPDDYRVEAYFRTVLNSTAYIADKPLWDSMYTHPTVSQMPCYPAAGSVAMVDGVMVVKLGPVS